MVRRREVKSASDLLRIVFAYAICDWSFRLVGAWCALQGVGRLSDVAVRKRVQGCQEWLGRMIAAVLQSRLSQWQAMPGVRLRLMDATCVSRPGSVGTDWRVHLSLDLGRMCVDGVTVSDCHTGETFAHAAAQPGDILVGDGGYSFASSLAPVLLAKASVIVRINWQSLPLWTPDGERLNPVDCLSDLPPGTSPLEIPVMLQTQEGGFLLRLVVAALPQQAAERARQRVRKQASKKGKTPTANTLLAAGFVLIATNLPAETWPPYQVLRIYRWRWQIELYFKRLKSLLHFDHLRAQTPTVSQVYLLAKLLAALLLDDYLQMVRPACPAWFASQPASLWRLSHLFCEALCCAVRGVIAFPDLLTALPLLTRFLADSPRQRPCQFSLAQAFFSSFSGP
jgi:hypothetical protein